MPEVKEFEFDQDYGTDDEALEGSKGELRQLLTSALREHFAMPKMI